MPDAFDAAQKLEEAEREGAAKMRQPEGPKPTGRCHNCKEMLPGDQRFCDADCRDDWAARNRK